MGQNKQKIVTKKNDTNHETNVPKELICWRRNFFRKRSRSTRAAEAIRRRSVIRAPNIKCTRPAASIGRTDQPASSIPFGLPFLSSFSYISSHVLIRARIPTGTSQSNAVTRFHTNSSFDRLPSRLMLFYFTQPVFLSALPSFFHSFCLG